MNKTFKIKITLASKKLCKSLPHNESDGIIEYTEQEVIRYRIMDQGLLYVHLLGQEKRINKKTHISSRHVWMPLNNIDSLEITTTVALTDKEKGKFDQVTESIKEEISDENRLHTENLKREEN